MEAISNPTFKNFFHSLTQHLLQNHTKCQIIFCSTLQSNQSDQSNQIKIFINVSKYLAYRQIGDTRTYQQKNCFLSGWLRSFWSLAQVVLQNFYQSSFPPLKNNSDSSSTIPSPKANLFASVFASNSNLGDQGVQLHHFTSPLQSSLCQPLKSPHKKSVKPFSSLTPPNPKALMVFQQ